jgi:hypothetical protein
MLYNIIVFTTWWLSRLQMNDLCTFQTVLLILCSAHLKEDATHTSRAAEGFWLDAVVGGAQCPATRFDRLILFWNGNCNRFSHYNSVLQQIMDGAVQRRVDWVSLRENHRWVTLMSTAPSLRRRHSARSEIHPLSARRPSTETSWRPVATVVATHRHPAMLSNQRLLPTPGNPAGKRDPTATPKSLRLTW